MRLDKATDGTKACACTPHRQEGKRAPTRQRKGHWSCKKKKGEKKTICREHTRTHPRHSLGWTMKMHVRTEKERGDGGDQAIVPTARKRPNTSAAHGSVISANWLLDAASAWLAANKGARCPLRVALASLSNAVRDRLVATTDLRGPALEAARTEALELARSTPEILCTLVMCDLCVSWSRSLLASVRPRVGAGMPPDFVTLTAAFAEASVAQKKADDPSPLYVAYAGADDSERRHDDDNDVNDDNDRESQKERDAQNIVHAVNSTIDGDHGVHEKTKQDDNDSHTDGNKDGHRKRAYGFANEATYVAYRYFLRHAWEGLAGVPDDWQRPLPGDVCGWLDSAMRMRDLALTLPQHRLCLPGGPTVVKHTDGPSHQVLSAGQRHTMADDRGKGTERCNRQPHQQQPQQQQYPRAACGVWGTVHDARPGDADHRPWPRRPRPGAPAPVSSAQEAPARGERSHAAAGGGPVAKSSARTDDNGRVGAWASAARSARRR
ncbi:hypothetical protein pclt_cds_242 [Pandoravirus celtis]|uniref:Uncharacterized protein n=1 Tax=Pandoravirus celtis TaxID=2568002 RepID=A0A4D6EG57_9VIRU|nr:hypothetical protein pclt_cds_242 [Pandoravirus celtis]